MSYDRRSGDKRKRQQNAFAAKVKKSDEGKAWRKANVVKTGADNEKLEADKSSNDMPALPDMDGNM